MDIFIDSKNHFSKKTTTKYALPNNYGKIAADTGTTTEASCTHDTFTLSGDSWIKTTVSKDKVSFAHQAPQTTNLSSTIEDTDKTPKLGGTFSVPKISYDSKGHVSSKSSYTITLPSLSLSGAKGNNDNVMTNLTYTQNGDTFTATFGKIGDLALTGYSTPTSIATDITATDSLNVGLGKLRYYINKEAEDRGNAITTAINDLDYTDLESDEKYVSRVDEVSGVINVTHKTFPTATVDKKGLVQVVTDQNAAQGYEDYQVPCMEMIDDLWGQLDGLMAITASFDYKAMVKNTTTGEITQENKHMTFAEFVNRISLIEKLLVNTTNKTLDDQSLTTS